jgi:hypothetical protein
MRPLVWVMRWRIMTAVIVQTMVLQQYCTFTIEGLFACALL